MSLRTRLLLAFAAVVLIPIALLAFGLRQEMSRRLSEEYQLRVDRVVEVIREDLARESAGIGDRLASLASALGNDNRFRLAAVAGVESERDYLLDYAGAAMRLTGLSMLQIQDGEDRIISSGHFRNEHGRVESGLASALRRARGVAFVTTRGADREFLALARVESFVISGRTFTMLGGVAVDEAFLARLARDRGTVVSLRYPGAEPLRLLRAPDTTDDSAVGELQLPVIRRGTGAPLEVVQARLEVTQPLTPLRALLRSADRWFLATAVGTESRPCCWRCGCHRASVGRWRISLKRRRFSISIGSTSPSIRARTKSADCLGFLVTLPRGCAPAQHACGRRNGARRSASWPARSTTTSRTASSRFGM